MLPELLVQETNMVSMSIFLLKEYVVFANPSHKLICAFFT